MVPRPEHGNDTRDPQASYANVFEITFSAREFYLDFAQFSPRTATTTVHTRIVTGPRYAKEFLILLGVSIDRFEREHGPIEPGAEAP
jgi:hypothetical protein